MSFSEFKNSPWSKPHALYGKGILAMTPAPEYATSEVVLSSLYRVLGFTGTSERSVSPKGTELQTLIKKARERASAKQRGVLGADALDTLLNSVLESPKRPNQSGKRFLQVTPLVPQAALFSGSARLKGNPWTPGALVRRMIWLGASSPEVAEATWRRLFEALDVKKDDDVFARFVQSELEAWLPTPSWTYHAPEASEMPDGAAVSHPIFPARQFVEDLNSIIASKDLLTRRQWTSLLEAVLRLGTVSHVIWLCEVHSFVWGCLSRALSGEGPTSVEEARQQSFPDRFSFLPLSNRPLPGIKDSISRYLTARIGINAILWRLQEDGKTPGDLLGSAEGLLETCNQIRSSLIGQAGRDMRELIAELLDRERRTLLCSKGIGSNLNEFVTYSLQQRQTANPRLRGYDQGYILRKKGVHSSSPWIVSLGPVAVIALVHCSLAGVAGPRSVHRLAQHLAQYGVGMDHRDIPKNELGLQLRMLGLVLDSPDAESGMLLVPPFAEAKMGGDNT